MKKVIKRSLVKTVTWRLIGSTDTFVVSYIVTGTFEAALKIGVIGLFTKMIMYFVHELVWNKRKKKELKGLVKPSHYSFSITYNLFFYLLTFC